MLGCPRDFCENTVVDDMEKDTTGKMGRGGGTGRGLQSHTAR